MALQYTPTLTPVSSFVLPDGQGSAPSKGVNGTGIAPGVFNGVSGFWVANDGRTVSYDTTYEQSILFVAENPVRKLIEIDLQNSLSGSVQGIVADPVDGLPWVMADGSKLMKFGLTGALLQSVIVPSGGALTYNPNSDDFIVISNTGVVTLVDRVSFSQTTAFTIDGYAPDHAHYDVSRDLLMISEGASGQAGKVHLIDFSTRTELATLTMSDAESIEGIAIDPSSDRLLVVSNELFHFDFRYDNSVLSYDLNPVFESLGLSSDHDQAPGQDLTEPDVVSDPLITINGTSGNDTLNGTSADELITGLAGHDSLVGWNGDDSVSAGSGHDLARGWDGDDTVDGGDGVDRVRGDNGDDLVTGGRGDDNIHGGNGDDTLEGGSGNDYLRGDAGHDLMTDLIGRNTFVGSSGNDTIKAGNDRDTVWGGVGDDLINVGGGVDSVRGGRGNDQISLGSGDDHAYGQEGNDLIRGDHGADRIVGGSGNDTIFGGDGDDRLIGSSGDNSFYGDAGNDKIAAGIGNDLVLGGTGNDQIWGGSGRDTLVGGRGNDTIDGGYGDDVYIINHGDGADQLVHFDRLSGNDVIEFRGFGSSYDEASEILAISTQAGGSVLIDFGNGQTVTIVGNRLSEFEADDITFG